MKKLLALLILPLTLLAQTNVQKGSGNVLSNGSVVVGSGTSITATGTGSIAATSGWPAYQSNASVTVSGAATTITPASGNDTQNLTLSGTAGSRTLIVSNTNILPGAHCDLLFSIPTTAGLVVTVRSGAIDGPVLQTFTTTGVAQIPSARLSLEFSGTNWQAIFYQGPIP